LPFQNLLFGDCRTESLMYNNITYKADCPQPIHAKQSLRSVEGEIRNQSTPAHANPIRIHHADHDVSGTRLSRWIAKSSSFALPHECPKSDVYSLCRLYRDLAGFLGRNIESRATGHHSLETDTDTFDDCQEDCATDGAVSHRFGTASDGEGATYQTVRWAQEEQIGGVLPVKKPAMMAFHGSSFFRMPLTAQSKDEKSPPQTPKLPPRTGARALMAVSAGEGPGQMLISSIKGAKVAIPPILLSP
jgi:hypothetical protein